MGGWGAALKGAGALLGSNPAAIGTTLKYVGKTMLYVPTGVYVGWKVFGKGEGLDEVAVGVALGEQAKENYKAGGAVDALKGKVAGQDAVGQSVGQVVVDGVAGTGTYQKAGETVGNVVDGAGNVITVVGQGVQNAYHGVGEIVSSMMQGQGGQQMPMTDQQIYQAYQQQALAQQQPQGGGLLNMLNPFQSIGNMLGSVTSGGTGMSLAALIPAAFLMFGNFGWMGKIASLFLGSLAMKNMRQQQVLAPSSMASAIQQGQQQFVVAPVQEQYRQQLALANKNDDESNVVHRGRGV